MPISFIEELYQNVIDGDEINAEGAVKKALANGTEAITIFNEGITKAMNVVGEKYSVREYGIPDILMSAEAAKKAMDILKPHFKREAGKESEIVVIGVVKGDIHSIGKNFVKLMLESTGFTVHDLGVNVSPDTFIEKVKETNANIIALGTLMSTTMPNMKETVKCLKQNFSDKKILIIGGAPTSSDFAQEIGADAWAESGDKAVPILNKLLTKRGMK